MCGHFSFCFSFRKKMAECHVWLTGGTLSQWVGFNPLVEPEPTGSHTHSPARSLFPLSSPFSLSRTLRRLGSPPPSPPDPGRFRPRLPPPRCARPPPRSPLTPHHSDSLLASSPGRCNPNPNLGLRWLSPPCATRVAPVSTEILWWF